MIRPSPPVVDDGRQGLSEGVPPQAGSGHSRAEPEEVSALRASVPNAVEAVARGLFLAEHPNAEWNGGRARAIWWTRAYAALEALREPTDEMIEAAAATPGMEAANSAMQLHQARGYGFKAGAFNAGSPLHQAWRAMIDRALAWPTSADVASAIEARRAATTGAVHESATGKAGDAQPGGSQ